MAAERNALERFATAASLAMCIGLTAACQLPSGEGTRPSTSGGAGGSETGGAGAGGDPVGGSGAVGGGGSGAVGGDPAGGSGAVGGDPAGGEGGVGGSVAMSGKIFDAGNNPDRNAVSAGQVCERLATIQCAGEHYCCDDSGRSQADCQTVMTDGCRTELFLDTVSGEVRAGFDPAIAENIFTEFERLASTCDASIASFGIATNGLRSMLTGTLAAGANCKPGNTRDTADVATSLVSCTSPATHACLASALLWSCAALSGAGGPCVTDLNCHEGLYCDNPAESIGDCATRKSDKSSCVYANECQSLFCKGSQCVAADVQVVYCLAK